MKYRILYLCGAVVLLSALLLGACAKPTPVTPIKIGAIIDFTGVNAVLAPEMQNGCIQALEEVGYKVAGRPIEFKVEDGGTDPSMAMDKVRKLVEADGISILLGPIQAGEAAGVAGYLDRMKVPCISFMGLGADLALNYNWMFLTCGTMDQLTYATGVYAYKDLGYRTATAIGADYVAGHQMIQGFKEGFEDNGGKLLQEQYYGYPTKDFTQYIVAMKQADCVVPWVVGADAMAFFPQYKELGLKMPFVQPEDGGMTLSPGVIKELGNAIVGDVIGAAYVYTIDSPQNKQFVQAYQKRWNSLPGSMSGLTYTSTQIALEALRKTGGDTSPEALSKALTGVSIDTVRGHISFSPNRIATFPYFMVKIDNNLAPTVVSGDYYVTVEKVGNTLVPRLAK